MGGELHQCSTVGFQALRRRAHCQTFLCTSRGVKCGAYCEVCWSGPTSFARLHRMPVEDLCRRFRVSLVCFVCTQAVRRRARDFPFTSYGWNFCVARFACIPYAVIYPHEKADPHGTKNSLVVYGSASVFATREQRGAAVRRDAKPCGNIGKRIAWARRSSPGSSCGPLFICAAFFSPAPRPRAGMSSGH